MSTKILLIILAVILFGGLIITLAFGVVGIVFTILFGIGMFLVKTILPLLVVIAIGVFIHSKLK